jgi:hypothetical protein
VTRSRPRWTERFYYETRKVASLPAVFPRIEGPPCMLGPAWWRRVRWIAARRTRADCCWYHSVDWHAVSETAIRLARQYQAAGVPVEDIAETVATTFGGLAGADLQGLVALLDVDNGIVVVDDDPGGAWINEGRHRVTAMRDAGVRRTILIGADLVSATGDQG